MKGLAKAGLPLLFAFALRISNRQGCQRHFDLNRADRSQKGGNRDQMRLRRRSSVPAIVLFSVSRCRV